MKRCLLLFVAVAAALAMVAAPAFAAVQGTAHQTNAGSQGVCSACHIPHGGTGGAASRLWPVAPTSTATAPVVVVGAVATLCASCHLSTGAYNGSMSAAFSDMAAYHNLGHGGKMTVANITSGGLGSSSMTNSGLPYIANTTLECTSCHNVHEDGNRPFLRAEMDSLCSRCHSNRMFKAGVDSNSSTASKGAWGLTWVGNANPGSHPVGTDITGNVSGGASPITLAGNFILAKTSAAGTWSLGGHLADNNGAAASSGGVTCNTCHAVHGIHPDGGTISSPVGNMLVIAQSTGANEGVSGHSIFSGDGSAGNGLCEACHVGAAAAGYTGSRAVNPGGTAGTHPVDDYAAQYEAVGAFQAQASSSNWPASSTVSGTGNAAICESCHTPHPKANVGRATIKFAATDNTPYILRDTTTAVCGDCHNGTQSITKHHPVGDSIASAKTGAASYLPGGSTLTCGTCHGGASGGAHNWAGRSQVAMVSSWKPANNGRSAGTTYRYATTGNTSATTQDISSTCIDCHLDLDGIATNYSPTTHTPTTGVNATDTANYTNLGAGSHFIGTTTAAFFGTRAIPSGTNRTSTNNFAVLTDNWTTTVFGAGNAGNGISRFGGTAAAPIVVCESCHSVIPSRNVGSHMLLAQYFEGQQTDTGGATFDTFCEGCHGVPTGTHQQSTDCVARTNAALSTTINTTDRPWLAAAAPAAVPGGTGSVAGTSTWGTNKVTCDSCHQPHDAATNGASLIIEAPSANIGASTPVAVTVAGGGSQTAYYGGGTINLRLKQQAPAVGTMPDVSRFCDQCHTYRGN